MQPIDKYSAFQVYKKLGIEPGSVPLAL